jgi:N-acetylated-alpha-linked acidic dipeptidase
MRLRLALLVPLAAAAAALAYFFFTRRPTPFVSKNAAAVEAFVSAARIESQTAELSRKPHRAGSAANFEVADLVLERLRRAGLEPFVQTHKVDLYEPAETRLTLLAKTGARELDLAEPGSEEKPFLAYSPDADVQAGVVYANYGDEDDYDLLAHRGIDPKGKIALVRAQGVCRGRKEEIAAARGVVGLLLFAEPRDQGFAKPSYPDGPNIPRRSAPRGSLLAYHRYPGDPRQARILGVDTLPRVPALTLSQENAETLLGAMEGEAAPEGWKGWLKSPYVLAKTLPRARMRVSGSIESKTIKNVFAVVSGGDDDAPPVLVGSHFDAWVHGAVDPCSGVAAVLEAAETLQRLASSGWKPRRSVVFAFWDGEESGMLGSTKWVEKSLRDAPEGLTAYLNVDSAVRAHDFIGNVAPGLRGALDEALKAVRDPDTGQPLFAQRGRYDLPGFSSDAAPFAGLTQTPVAEIGFGRWFPVYHTAADSIDWMRRFGDPGFKHSAALANVLTLFAGTLAGDEILPYDFAEIGAWADASLTAVYGLRPGTSSWLPQQLQGAARQLQYFQEAARAWNERRQRLRRQSDAQRKRVNALLRSAMSAFGRSATPGREGSDFGRCNGLYGPSDVTGCGAEPFATLSRAARGRDRAAAQIEAARLERAFAKARDLLVAAEWVASGKTRRKS